MGVDLVELPVLFDEDGREGVDGTAGGSLG